jgi:hypothetical protein
MGYVGTAPLSGDYRKLDDISGTFNGDDNVTFNLTVSSVAVTPPKETTMLISVGGILQEPVTAYTISGSTITFTAAPATGADFFGILLGEATTIGTPADATITAAKVENTFISGQTEITSGLAAADEFLYSDGGTIKRVGLDTLADKLAGTNITATAGVLASASTAYTGAANGGIGLSGTAFSLDIDGMNDIGAGIATGDTFAIDDGDGGTNKKTTVDRIATLFAGTGLTASSGVIGVDASQGQITTVGALGAGSIDTGFGIINNAAAITGTTVTGTAIVGGTVAGTTAAFSGLISANGGITLTDGDDITFTGATGTNDIVLVNGLADALSITDGTADVITISTAGTTTPGQRNAVTITGDLFMGQASGGIATGGYIRILSSPINNSSSGIVGLFTAGEALSIGECVYLKASDGKMWKAKSGAGATGLISAEIMCVALCAYHLAADVEGEFLLQGFLTSSVLPTYTVGETLYVPEAETDANGSTRNVPEGASPDSTGDFVQVVGWAAGASTIYFNPDFTIIEHA